MCSKSSIVTSAAEVAANRSPFGQWANHTAPMGSRRSHVMTTKMQKTLVALAVGATFAASGAVMAATLTWDSSGSSPTAPVDGAGTWNTTGINWSNGTTDSVWNNTADSSYIASFGSYVPGSANNAGTVTLGSNITAGGLLANAAYAGTTYTIAGSGSYGLTLTGPSVVVNASLTLSANTTFQEGLNLTGGSGMQLAISGTNTNTVGTTVGSGVTLAMTNLNGLTNANFGAPLGTGPVTVNSGGILNISGGDSTGTIANSLAISGSAGGGALTLAGLNDTFNVTGPITLSNGGPGNNAQIMAANGYGIITNLDGVISGNGNLTLNGQGSTTNKKDTINLNAAETYTGSTYLYSYAGNTLITLNGGTNTLPVGTALTLAPSIWSGSQSPLALDLHGNNQQVAGLTVGSVAGTGSIVTIEDTTGTGATLTVPGGSGFGFGLQSGGTVNFNTNINAAGNTNSTGYVWFGTTLNVNKATFDAPYTLVIGINGQSGTVNVNSGGIMTSVGEYIINNDGEAGVLNIATGGTVNSYLVNDGNGSTGSGTVNINGGTLNTDGIFSGGGTGTLNLNGGTLAVTGPGAVQTPWIASNIAINVQNGGVTVDVPTAANAIVDSPFLEGPNGSTGGVTVTGGGTLTMTGANTYTGPTVVQSGTLALGTYTYTPSGATSSTTQIGSIVDSSMLTINSGGTFDISAITATPIILKGLTISGGTINVAMDGSGNVSNFVLNSAAIVSGANTINFAAASGVTALTPGTYTLLADASGGLAGTFLFGNGTNSDKYLLGSDSYMLTLENSNTAETLNVGAATPVPEPAALGLFALGGLALMLIGRMRAARRSA